MAAAQAVSYPILDFSFSYGGAASSSGVGPLGTFQYCAVKCTGNDMEVAPSSSGGVTIAANSACLGVLQTANTGTPSGAAAQVRISGLTKLVVDGSGTTIKAGDFLVNDAAGRGVKVANPSSSASTFAMALQGSTAAGDIITALLTTPSQLY